MHLEGTWHVIASNFSLWKKGDRRKPRFIYSNERTVDGRVTMDDTVVYEKGGHEKKVLGVDTQDAEHPTRYVWRGSGWLLPFTSRWEIIWISADRQLSAIRFTKTLITHAGIDMIARTEEVSDEVYATALKAIGSPNLQRLKDLT